MAATLDPKVQIAAAYQRMARSTRRPQHKFNLRTLPYQIQPTMIAPVLPGETLKSVMLQSQLWADPLSAKMKNIGWWCEYNFFYVKHRDLADPLRSSLTSMMLDPTFDMSAHLLAAATTVTYSGVGAIDFVQACLERVVEEYFRDHGEAWNVATVGGVPLARIYGKGNDDAFEHLTNAADYRDDRVSMDADNDGDVTLDEVEKTYYAWAGMRDAGLTDMDYEDYLATYGVQGTRQPEASPTLHKPEDIGHIRQFTYPTNTVDPVTGNPATAVGWRVSERIDKHVFCKEPGFIVGYNVVRPKVYLRPQKGAISGWMTDVMSWLPAVLNNEHTVSHKQFAKAAGPLNNVLTDAGGYWIDLRDLLLNGDQFINYSPTAEVPFVDLPAASGARRYATEANLRSVFADTVNGNFEQDGVVSLNILGRQREKSKAVTLGKA
jgi:hypothetical protein